MRQSESQYQNSGDKEALGKAQSEVKALTLLLDQFDLQAKVVQSLDTPIFTYNRTMQ